MINRIRALLALCLLWSATASALTLESDPDNKLRVVINEISNESQYVELYFPNRTDVSGWALRWANKGNHSASQVIPLSGLGASDIYPAGTFLVISPVATDNVNGEVLLTSDDGTLSANDPVVVHYVNFANRDNNSNKKYWAIDDADTGVFIPGGNDGNICALPDGSDDGSDWQDCEPSPGGPNDPDTPLPIFPPMLDQCEARFPTPLSGLTAAAQVTATDGQLLGTDGGQLGFQSASQLNLGGGVFCDGLSCTVNGSLAQYDRFPAFQAPLPDAADLFVPPATSRTLTNADGFDFNEVNAQAGASLTLNGDGPYYLNILEVADLGSLTLAPGRYFIDRLTLGDNVTLTLSGATQLFVGEWSVGSDTRVNTPTSGSAGTVDWLEVYLYRDFGQGIDAEISGYLYLEGEANLGDQARFYGAISGAQALNLGFAAQVDGRTACAAPPPATVPLELGTLSLTATGNTGDTNPKATATLVFDNTYTTPPVVVVSPSLTEPTGSDGPATVRVIDVTTTQATVEMVVPPGNRDAAVTMLSVPYLVMGEGELALQDAGGSDQVWLKAGRVETLRHQGKRTNTDNRGYESFTFPSAFASTPVVLTQRLTDNNGAYLTTFATSVSVSGANLTLEASEVPVNVTATETVGYIAISGGGTVDTNGTLLQWLTGVGRNHSRGDRATRNLDQQCADYYVGNAFSPAFSAPPLLLHNKQARRGGDGGWTRACRIENDRFTVGLDEDQSQNNERSHYWEPVAFVAIEAPVTSQLFYRIEHDGSGVTCLGEPVTVRVCNDANCNSPSSVPVNVTLSPGSGWDGGNSLTVTGSATVDLWHGAAEPVTVGITNPQGPVSCWVGGSEVALNQCIINYASSALVLEPGAPLGCRDETLVVKAVRASDQDPLQCAPAMTGNQSLDFTLSAVSPAAPVGGPTFTLGGSALPFATTQSRTLNFNAQGEAQVAANYDDVGQLKLTARFQRDEGGETITLDGDSTFVVAPAGLHLSSPDSNALCASGDASCSAFTAAGRDFNLSVTAACWQADGDTDFSDNPVARNFQHAGVAVEPDLVAPAGGQTSTSGSVSVAMSAADQGVGSAATQVSEVGVFRWQLAEDAGGQRQLDYLGRSVSATSADNLGRFTPATLAVTANVPLLAGCTVPGAALEMGYLAQSLGFATAPRLTIQGLNANSQVTQNYNSAFWRLVTDLTPRSYADEAGRPAIDEPTAGSLQQENVGDTSQDRVLWLDGTEIAYRRDTTLVAPFDAAMDLTIDADALTDRDGICFDQGGGCQPLVIADITGVELRYGRLVMDNVYGSENQALTLPVRAEYYDGTAFRQNRLDNCTDYTATDVTLSATGAGLSGGGVLADGAGSLTLAPPASPLDALAEYQLLFPHYIQWYWQRDRSQDAVGRQCFDSDDTTQRLCNPKARVTFGRYRGHDKVIYRREILSE
ncbi:DUF6701 domain-containing protein [Ferrimonas balearica]|uniref:DUF6701 domain-containing protein n=1 Tax=Ferrimonas balearica TaxID=44012 RepID=UPI001C99B4A7|nr:DUF6701 domain-containing protein [Ferrimonas balearica]MBY5993125.1 hypothetical protein [Ferrimonas balearica]